MNFSISSIRPFIGARNFALSRQFYNDVGFQEIPTSYTMSFFTMGNFGFYLQDAYVKDWVDNSMIFLEVQELESHLLSMNQMHLENKYPSVRLSEIHYNEWGNEFFFYDPSGILWHVGEFASKKIR